MLCCLAYGELASLFLEPDTWLDHCPRILLSSFSARTSVDVDERNRRRKRRGLFQRARPVIKGRGRERRMLDDRSNHNSKQRGSCLPNGRSRKCFKSKVSPRQYRAISHLLYEFPPASFEKLGAVVVHYAVKLFTFFTAKLRGESAKMWVSKFGPSIFALLSSPP